jgi:hypothetical protein
VEAAPTGDPSAAGAPATPAIATRPATFDEAKASLEQIAALLRRDPNDPIAAQALRDIQPSLDALNHLVARVAPKTGHVVSFYESAPGVIGLSESGPIGEAPLLGAYEAGQSKLDVFRSLSGAEPPRALVEALARANDAASAPSAGAPVAGLVSASSAPAHTARAPIPMLNGSQGPWYASNGCYEGGDAHACLPDWWNGGWAEANAKVSAINVASITGTFFVQGKYQGTIVNIDPIYAGQWLYWYRESPWHCTSSYDGNCLSADYSLTDQRWDILDATNQEFDWSYEFKWNCVRTLGDPVPPLESCLNPQTLQ